ncbi:hypothetical protein Q4S45_04605 [Massilia sp. R2A-15]|uniref:tetratricopeptide repeat protein n=1 Tax=Massilia sp. R2A-15 TaxID=3064278 RepID=UPI002735CBFD|nr:hypothetical protein [Massilia sp. R2A-15]WLI90407.1 hypothetical protein Q4S45_04605 [Massilia sp. R2A-15]
MTLPAPTAEDDFRAAVLHLRANDGDAVAARALFSRAAERGHGRAQFNLALMLQRALGGPADAVGARQWLTLAAENGHAAALEALNKLAPETSAEHVERRELSANPEPATEAPAENNTDHEASCEQPAPAPSATVPPSPAPARRFRTPLFLLAAALIVAGGAGAGASYGYRAWRNVQVVAAETGLQELLAQPVSLAWLWAPNSPRALAGVLSEPAVSEDRVAAANLSALFAQVPAKAANADFVHEAFLFPYRVARLHASLALSVAAATPDAADDARKQLAALHTGLSALQGFRPEWVTAHYDNTWQGNPELPDSQANADFQRLPSLVDEIKVALVGRLGTYGPALEADARQIASATARPAPVAFATLAPSLFAGADAVSARLADTPTDAARIASRDIVCDVLWLAHWVASTRTLADSRVPASDVSYRLNRVRQAIQADTSGVYGPMRVPAIALLQMADALSAPVARTTFEAELARNSALLQTLKADPTTIVWRQRLPGTPVRPNEGDEYERLDDAFNALNAARDGDQKPNDAIAQNLRTTVGELKVANVGVEGDGPWRVTIGTSASPFRMQWLVPSELISPDEITKAEPVILLKYKNERLSITGVALVTKNSIAFQTLNRTLPLEMNEATAQRWRQDFVARMNAERDRIKAEEEKLAREQAAAEKERVARLRKDEVYEYAFQITQSMNRHPGCQGIGQQLLLLAEPDARIPDDLRMRRVNNTINHMPAMCVQ